MATPAAGYALDEVVVKMEPVPETERALQEFVEPDDNNLAEVLQELADVVRAIVPECVGLSLCLVREALTFTLVATGEEVAEVDAVQYVDGGPCVWEDTTGRSGAEEVVMDDLLDERRWELFARASAAAGIASSLSLTLAKEGEVVGGINLYASTPDAFSGHHDALTQALGATAGSAVRNADLSFETRRAAARAPEQLREQQEIDTALGMLAARYRESIEESQMRLSTAAARAGLTEVAVARVLTLLHEP